MNRRGFLGAVLAVAAAPAVIRYARLMPVRSLASGVVVPDWSFTDYDLTMTIDDFSRLYIRPAVEELVRHMDAEIMGGVIDLGRVRSRGLEGWIA